MHVQMAVPVQFEAFRDTVHLSDWHVEVINSSDAFVAIFCGPLAQERATEYADFMNNVRN
jgi:hypothetical protein